MYQINDLVRIAKREKNKKRSYLFVNPLQGKHIPSNPIKVEELCSKLSRVIDEDYRELSKFVIGFAETATGISATVCQFMNNVVYFEHTTREYNRVKEYIYFTESHSHAKEQLFCINATKEAVNESDLIILIDDEITTGNTVYKLIDQLRNKYDYNGLFVIASLVNSMTDERIAELREEGIECKYVLRIPHEYKAELAEQVDDREISDEVYEYYSNPIKYETFLIKSNPRQMVLWDVYFDEMHRLSEQIAADCNLKYEERVCIIGTEEFMYLTICLGDYLLTNKQAKEVAIHSTTRSPIVPSSQEGYPLFSRYKVNSLYSDKRITYIYNLIKYDKVIIVTDGSCRGKGIQSLISAVKSVGNDRVFVYRCKYEK